MKGIMKMKVIELYDKLLKQIEHGSKEKEVVLVNWEDEKVFGFDECSWWEDSISLDVSSEYHFPNFNQHNTLSKARDVYLDPPDNDYLIAYPIIIEKDESDGYCVVVPDFDAMTMGYSIAECMVMARDLITLLMSDAREHEIEVPTPNSVVFELKNDDIFTYVDIDTRYHCPRVPK